MRGMMGGAPGEQETRDLSLHQPSPSLVPSEQLGDLQPTSELTSHGPAGRPILEAAPGDA